MKIRVYTDKVHMTIPVPISLAGAALRFIPNAAFDAMKESVPQGYEHLVSRKAIQFYYKMSREIMAEYPGLEIVHVESHDGAMVSIIL